MLSKLIFGLIPVYLKNIFSNQLSYIWSTVSCTMQILQNFLPVRYSVTHGWYFQSLTFALSLQQASPSQVPFSSHLVQSRKLSVMLISGPCELPKQKLETQSLILCLSFLKEKNITHT
jgi:hypothetical protein